MKVTREKIGKRGFYSYDLEKDNKHLMLGLNERGDFVVSLIDNNERALIFEDDFEIKEEENNIIYSLFGDLYKSCYKYSPKIFEEDDIIFNSYGSTISLRKEDNKYILNFTKDYGKVNNIVKTTLLNDCNENENFIKTFIKMQEYDPKFHQVSMEEYLKVLKKDK